MALAPGDRVIWRRRVIGIVAELRHGLAWVLIDGYVNPIGLEPKYLERDDD